MSSWEVEDGQTVNTGRTLGRSHRGRGSQSAREKLATSSRLGSHDNPVRCAGPRGEREYLARLRCDDGRAPAFARAGSVGRGADGDVLDNYLVQCAGQTTTNVYMDMYHGRYR